MPADHESAQNKIASDATIIPRLDVSVVRPTSNPTPASPRNTPANIFQLNCQRLVARAARKKTKIGSVATSNEASPEGTRVSAQCSGPCPSRKNKIPITMPVRICDAVGRTFFAKHHSSKIVPDAKWRMPAAYRGGMVSTASRMAKYVE